MEILSNLSKMTSIPVSVFIFSIILILSLLKKF
ncbi:hypothetical protein [Leptotrichia alba]|uniref:Uncharacterized protein n=1 Tax=Leptotrichia alba TaxID=3239304 RepID=A0AB39V591_9FUSO